MSDDEITELPKGNMKETVGESTESKESGQGKVTVPYGEMLVNLRKEKRTRKTRLTKLKHRLQKLFKTRAEREEIESCIEEIWEILEEQAVMDDMSVENEQFSVTSKNNERIGQFARGNTEGDRKG